MSVVAGSVIPLIETLAAGLEHCQTSVRVSWKRSKHIFESLLAVLIYRRYIRNRCSRRRDTREYRRERRSHHERTGGSAAGESPGTYDGREASSDPSRACGLRFPRHSAPRGAAGV